MTASQWAIRSAPARISNENRIFIGREGILILNKPKESFAAALIARSRLCSYLLDNNKPLHNLARHTPKLFKKKRKGFLTKLYKNLLKGYRCGRDNNITNCINRRRRERKDNAAGIERRLHDIIRVLRD